MARYLYQAKSIKAMMLKDAYLDEIGLKNRPKSCKIVHPPGKGVK